MKPHRHFVVENIGGGGSSLSVNGAGKSTLLRSSGQDEHDQHISRRIKDSGAIQKAGISHGCG
jgi:hypothetical protein